MNEKKFIRIKEHREELAKILGNITFKEKKQVLRKVDQSMINSANKVLANDNPPGEFLTKLPTKFKSEVQAKAMQLGRNLFVRAEVDELFKRKRKDNIKIVK
tara:strand:- start:122 stop:427 length:306 start_codon:yes stop_codon:yes gene_type:complete